MFNHSQVKLDLGLLDDSFKQFEEQANLLAQRKMSDKEAIRFIMNVLTGEDDAEKLSTRSANVVKHVYGLYTGNGMGSSLRAAESSAWGALNAVTQYVDHEQGRNVNNRFRSAQFGVGATTKADALQKALALAA
jgi:hypothetical protein